MNQSYILNISLVAKNRISLRCLFASYKQQESVDKSHSCNDKHNVLHLSAKLNSHKCLLYMKGPTLCKFLILINRGVLHKVVERMYFVKMSCLYSSVSPVIRIVRYISDTRARLAMGSPLSSSAAAKD